VKALALGWALSAVAYVVLAHALDHARLGFVLLAGGAPPWAIACAALLVLLRLFVVLAGPGVVLAAAGWLAQKMWLKFTYRPASSSLKP
jgi:hypothetical protein